MLLWPDPRPGEMKDYLYSLETKSLTSLGEDVRALTKNIGGMSEKISDIGSQVKSLETIVKIIAVPFGIGLCIGLILLIIQIYI